MQHSFTPFNWDPENPKPGKDVEGWGGAGILRCQIHPRRGGGSVPVQMCVSAAYLAVQLLHGDEVQGLEGMSRRGDEVQADVDPGVVVVEERTLDLQLLLEVVLKLRVDVVHDGFVAVGTDKEKVGGLNTGQHLSHLSLL